MHIIHSGRDVCQINCTAATEGVLSNEKGNTNSTCAETPSTTSLTSTPECARFGEAVVLCKCGKNDKSNDIMGRASDPFGTIAVVETVSPIATFDSASVFTNKLSEELAQPRVSSEESTSFTANTVSSGGTTANTEDVVRGFQQDTSAVPNDSALPQARAFVIPSADDVYPTEPVGTEAVCIKSVLEVHGSEPYKSPCIVDEGNPSSTNKSDHTPSIAVAAKSNKPEKARLKQELLIQKAGIEIVPKSKEWWVENIGVSWVEALGLSVLQGWHVSGALALYEHTQRQFPDDTYPPKDHLFRAFRTTPFPDVKVVILGQDPYHQPGQATGLAFSVPQSQKPPPSLVNIFKEICPDGPPPPHGDLTAWAEQGVLLLNTILSVSRGQALGHQHFGWSQFVDDVIRRIAAVNDRPIAFLLWGQNARSKMALIHEIKFGDASKTCGSSCVTDALEHQPPAEPRTNSVDSTTEKLPSTAGQEMRHRRRSSDSSSGGGCEFHQFGENIGVFASAHPSPLSIGKFKGCNHFVLVNDWLQSKSATTIDWLLPAPRRRSGPLDAFMVATDNTQAVVEVSVSAAAAFANFALQDDMDAHHGLHSAASAATACVDRKREKRGGPFTEKGARRGKRPPHNSESTEYAQESYSSEERNSTALSSKIVKSTSRYPKRTRTAKRARQ